MNPLGTLVYLRRNASRTLPLMGVIVLAVLLICAIVSLINSIPLSVKTIYKYTSLMMGVSPRGDASRTPEIRKYIEENCPVPIGHIALCRASGTEVKSIVGRWEFVVIAFEPADLQVFLKRMAVTKIEGRVPEEGQPEAIISEPVSRNLQLKIGDDLLSPEKADAYSPKKVKVVGIAQTKNWFMFGDKAYYQANHFPPIDFIIVTAKNPADQPAMDRWTLHRFKGNRAQVISYLEIERQANEMFKTLYKILDVVIGILVIVITTMMGMLINIYLGQRTQEFALLQALGYSRRALMSRVIKETAWVVIGGWILGVLTSVGMLMLVDRLLMHPNAYALDLADKTALMYTIPVPIAIFTAAILTLWARFRKFDPVSVVERRLV
ncbi:MAG: ABC transporter permease [Chthonomonas sp.]|nr:ABC transporter permease [Chthonomonas sp.]